MRILIAEDNRDLNRVLVKHMTALGWAADACFDGEDAVYYAKNTNYDCIILDINMPKLDGLQALRQLRTGGCDSPVLFLTARDAIEDRIEGLDAGACDYIVKPFSIDELAARVRAATRKLTGNTTNTYTVGDLCVDIRAKSVTRGGKSIDLSAKEYAVLEYMIRNKGRVLSREQIENNVWNFDYEGGSNVVDVYIRYLRMKIDKNSNQPLIHTVRGSGYVLRED